MELHAYVVQSFGLTSFHVYSTENVLGIFLEPIDPFWHCTHTLHLTVSKKKKDSTSSVNPETRHFGRRHSGAENFGHVRNPCLETQCKGSHHAEKW